MEINCPHCNRKLRVPDNIAHHQARCPSCSKVFSLPAPEAGGGSEEPVATAMPSATASQPTRPCPFCGEQIMLVAQKCKHCGEWLQGGTAAPSHAINDNKPLFLYIPVVRLIILSIVSFSLYEAYWIYKNWRYIKERDGLNIHPFWRGVFGIFFCHSLLRRIHQDNDARSFQQPAFSPGGLATGWVVLIIAGNVISRLPSMAASIVSAFIPSFLCLVSVQNYVNAVTEKRNPSQRFYGWSAGHIVCLVIGLLVWAGLLLGLAEEMGRH